MDRQQGQLRGLCKKGKLKEVLARVQSTGSLEKLKQGFEPDLSQPLHYASIRGDLDVVRELIESYGCDPVCQNVYGITPLHCASYCSHLNVVDYLLKYCSSAATLKDTEGACPLVYLAYCTIKYPGVTVHAPLDIIKQVSLQKSDRIQICKLLLSFTNSETIQECPSPMLAKLLCILRLAVYNGSPADMKDMVQTIKPLLKSDEEFNREIYNCLKIAADKKRWKFVKYLLHSFSQPIQVAMASNTEPTFAWELTPFQNACKKANLSVIKIFLDLNICMPDVQAIKEAIDRKYYDLVRYLLKSAKRPVVMDRYRYTSESSFLSYVLSSYKDRISVHDYKPELVRLIASNGINGRDVEGNTVLHLACKYSVMFLIEEHYHDQNAVNNSNQLPLHIACSQCNLEVIKLVSSQRELNVNIQDSDGNTPIHLACKFEYRHDEYVYAHEHHKQSDVLQCVRYLVQGKKCDLNIQNNEGKLPIHILLENISWYYHFGTTEDLNNELIRLVSNCEYLNINAQDKDGNTPLHIAFMCRNLKAVLYLTSNFQCDINLCNNDGNFPLHCAVGSYHGASDSGIFMEAIKAVSKKCMQLHKQNHHGMTPLHIACKNEWMDVVLYLVFDKKCSPSLCDSNDTYNSLDIHLACKKESDIDLLKALANKLNVNNHTLKHEYFGRGNTPLHVACTHHNLQAIKLLKELNCDFTLKNFKGMIPLHIACSKSLECVKLLDIQNEDVIICDESGNTPLHYACKHNLKDVVRYLVFNFVCDLTIQNREDELPLHLACSTSLEIVQMVSNCKLNFNSQTKEGNTPLHIACRAGKFDIVKHLIAICKCDISMKIRNRYDRLPIHYACKHSLELMKMVDQTSTIKDLLSRSTHYISKRMSALDIACSHGSLDMVVYLINKKGCTLSALQNDKTALRYACGAFKIDELRSSDRDIWDDASSSSAHPNVVEYLITECGYDPSIIFRDDYYAYTSVIEHACLKGNLDLMRALTVLSVDIIDHKGNTPLHYASMHCCTTIAQFLIDHGCNQTITNHEGELALHIACRHSLQIVELLSNCDVDSLTLNEDANSPLHIACENDQKDIVLHLVNKRKCNVNTINARRESALHIACRVSLTIIKVLKGCDVNSTNADGNTALHIACIEKNLEIVKYLLQDELCCAEIPNNSGDLPLHIIMKDFQPDLVLVMTMLQKCDVNSQDSHGNTALHIACSKLNHEVIMHLLQDKLCRADIPNRHGELPLQCIILSHFRSFWLRKLDMAENLQVITMVANRHSRAAMTADHTGLTPMDLIIRKGSIDLLKIFFKTNEVKLDSFLHLACKHKQTKVVRWLIDHGVNTELTDNDGNLPAHVCISNDDPSIETLLQLGTLNNCMQNKFGDTILHLACQVGNVDIVQHVLSTTKKISSALSIQNNSGDTPLHIIATREISPKILSLIKCSSPNQKNSDGNTPLHIACKNNNIKIAELLLKLQCDPNVCNNRGELPLHIACEKNNIKIAELLLKFQCDSNICNNGGELPLHIAASQSLELTRLFARSENVNSQMSNGDTPLHIACRYRKIKIILYLIIELKCSVQILNVNFDSPFHLMLSSSHVWDQSVLCHIPQSLCDTRNIHNDTILHIACRVGNIMAVSFLVESLKCNVNVTNEKSGATPLHFACSWRSIDLVKLVSESDPIAQVKDSSLLPDVQCVSGDTPLHVACKMGILKIIKYLLMNGHTQALNVRNSQDELPFHSACHHNNEKVIKLFIPYRTYFDCNAMNGSGDTPLHMACRMNPTVSNIHLFVNQMKCRTDVVDRIIELPLHIACRGIIVYHKVVKMLSAELDEDQLSLQNSNGNTALHELLECSHDYRRSGNLIHPIEVLAKKMPSLFIYNKDDKQPIHLACRHQRLYVIRYLCKLLSMTCITLPNAVLHEGCLNDNAGVLEYIVESVTELDANVPDEDGNLPLHLATHKMRCVNGTTLLVGKTENINYTKNQGNTPLHELYINTDNSQRFLPSSLCNNFDRLKVLSSFLARKDINLSVQNSNGQTPLHLICESGNYDDLEAVVVSTKKINPNIQDNDGLTPLHILSQANQDKGVQLLCSANANPSVKDNQGRTPLTLTSDPKIMNLLIEFGADPQPLYDMHKKFFQTLSSDGPPPTPVKLLMIGDPSVGKTTLVHSLKNEGSERMILGDKFEHTAGIVTTTFSSKVYGDVMFCDFAGQREYYASHDAIIHNTIKNVPPVILIVVNLTNSKKKICSQIHYWINFIAHRCASLNDKAHVIIICSHADILESQDKDPSIKVSKLLELIKSRIDDNSSIMILKEVLHMNCTDANSKEMKRLQQVLKDSTNQLCAGGVMLFNSHCFYVLLLQAFKDSKLSYVTLGHIIDKIKFSSRDTHKSPLFLLSSDQKTVTQMCKDLDNRSLIMFIEHPSVIEMSWVVLNNQPLLNDLLGSLFAPSNFPQHRPLSYSTGVVPLSRFKKCFGERYNYTATMKLTFLARMEYCREIIDEAILTSIVKQEGYSETDRYYFFPNLVSLERPIDKWSIDPRYAYKCGWLIQCTMEGDFFSPHFIQALLLRLAFAFVPKNQTYDSRDITVDEDDSDEEENQAMALVIKRVCSVWKNGIYWREQSGVVTIVEVIDEKTLVLLMQCPQGSEVQLIKRRSSIISMVFNAKNEFCPRANLIEYFLHPECVRHPFSLDKKMTFSIIDIQNSIKESDSIASGGIHVTNSFDKIIDLERLLYFEPYSELSTEMVIELFKEATCNSHKQVKHDLLVSIASQLKCRYKLLICLCHILDMKISSVAVEANDTNKLLYTLKQVQQRSNWGTYHGLCGFFNQISIFCGRQPPQVEALRSHDVLAQDESQEYSAHSEGDLLHYQPQEHQLDLIERAGKEVRVIKAVGSRWEAVATRLHFELSIINCIKKDNHYINIPSCREMFSRWLKGEGRQPADWETLIKALTEAEFSELARELENIIK